MADTPEELHEFASRLGLQRSWFQNHPRHPHYDLTENKRREAVSLGAIEVTLEHYRQRRKYTLKALSVKQPWAWLISAGVKTIETRTWATEYRGDLLIVSSKGIDRHAAKRFDTDPDSLLYGHALAVADLFDCQLMQPDDERFALCDVYEGAYSWKMRNIRRIEPFPVKGQLGLYNVEAPFLRHVA